MVIYGMCLMSQNHMSQSIRCRLQVINNTFGEAKQYISASQTYCFSDFNRFSHATGLDIWNRTKNVVIL